MDHYRFYLPDLRQRAGGEIALPDDQAHHARTVLRLGVGAEVVLFDGRGAWCLGKVKGAGKAFLIAPEGFLTEELPPVPALTMASAVPKGERAEWLIEQASQLNVSAVQWLSCERSVVKPGAGKMDKWRRLAIESAKQCGRAHLLQVLEPVTLKALLGGAGRALVWWLEPRGGEKAAEALTQLAADQQVMALVVPEGGWSAEESAFLESQVAGGRVRRVRLTTTVLRIETACAAVAALVMSR
jgi:16S rRNA (uracil1498-N3)-methyltransferase